MTHENETPQIPAHPTLLERLGVNRKKMEDDIQAAKAAMEALLRAPHDNEDALEHVLVRQGHILNDLFHRSLVDSAAPDLSGTALAFPLTIQRECRRTIESLPRIRRVKALSQQTAVKRTDSSRRQRPHESGANA